MKLIQLIIPVFNEEKNIACLYDQLNTLSLEIASKYKMSFLFINDGSTDKTLNLLKELSTKDDRVAIIDLSRNHGKEIAVLAGLDFSRGDAVIIMDGDLQHPPKIIHQFIREWEKGVLDVYALRKSRIDDPFFLRITKRLFYKLLNRYSSIKHIDGAGDFRLLDKKVVLALRSCRENRRYNKGLYELVGFKKKAVPYNVGKRYAGRSKWKFLDLLNLGIEGITSFSVAPLRIATIFGFLIAMLSFLYFIFYLAKTLIYGDPVKGFPTLISVILLLGGIQLITLGIIGEYIGVIFEETKKRPGYYVNEIINYYTDEE